MKAGIVETCTLYFLRAMGAGDQSAVKMDMVALLGGFKQGKPSSENMKTKARGSGEQKEQGSGDNRLEM